MRFVLFRLLAWLAALALLPACWAATRALGGALRAAFLLPEGGEGSFLVPEGWALLAGAALYALWHRLRPPEFLYTFSHELTHLVFGLLLGKKVGRFEVSRRGGAVVLSGTNSLITLAPYFFPLPVVLLLALGAAAEWAAGEESVRLAGAFLVGLALAFHLVMTTQVLRTAQSDIDRAGRLFSWVAIYLAGLVLTGGIVLLAVAGPGALLPFGRALLAEGWSAYSWAGPRVLAGADSVLAWASARWGG